MKNNCEYCDEGDDKKVCDECKEVYICEECYCVKQPYEDDKFFVIYVCRECLNK